MGLPRSTLDSDTRRSFPRRGRRWHPDRLGARNSGLCLPPSPSHVRQAIGHEWFCPWFFLGTLVQWEGGKESCLVWVDFCCLVGPWFELMVLSYCQQIRMRGMQCEALSWCGTTPPTASSWSPALRAARFSPTHEQERGSYLCFSWASGVSSLDRKPRAIPNSAASRNLAERRSDDTGHASEGR